MLFSVRSLGHRKADSGPTVLPSDWPSDLHNKCSVQACWYPNPPQAAVGFYNCLGRRSDGRQCRGVYTVTASMVSSMVDKYHCMRKEELLRAKQSIEAERARRPGEVQRKPSRATTLVRISRKLCKERSFRSLDYRKDKNLPGIPGLSQRKINKGPLASQPPLPTQAPADTSLYPEVRVRCLFPKDESSGFSQSVFSDIPQKPGYTPFRAPLVVPRRTLSRDLGFPSNSRYSLSVYSQMTNVR